MLFESRPGATKRRHRSFEGVSVDGKNEPMTAVVEQVDSSKTIYWWIPFL